MFDFAKTLRLVRGGIFQADAVWESYLAENPSPKQTLFTLVIPLITAQVVIGVLFSRIFGGFSPYGYGQAWLVALLVGLISAFIGFAIACAVFTLLAGALGGRTDWNRGCAALALAYIPSTVGIILAAVIPWVGGLIALAGAILAIIYLYRLMPLALHVPEGRRPLHFIAALVITFIINVIVISVLGLGAGLSSRQQFNLSNSDYNDDADSTAVTLDTNQTGMFSELERQGKLTEAAENDHYSAPEHGQVSEAQVKRLVSVIEKTRKLQEREEQRLQALAQSMEKKEQASISDLSRMFQGVGSAVGIHNAELEVVKTGGGNWAEHQWVKEQLRIALVQQEGSPAIEHNFALYEKYQEALADSI